MKTPLQELLDWEANLSQMFDSDHRIAMAVLEKIRTNRKEMLEKEKEVITYAHHCGRAFENKYPASDKHYDESAEQYYNETFNTKEK